MPSWSWSYGSWIYNYLCNQCLSPLTLCVWIPLRQGAFDTKLCDKVCQWLAAGTTVSSTNKTDHHDITKILLKVVLNTIKLNLTQLSNSYLEFKLPFYFFFRHFWIWSCKKLYFSNMLKSSLWLRLVPHTLFVFTSQFFVNSTKCSVIKSLKISLYRINLI